MADVAHVLVPGCGRDMTGRHLNAASHARVVLAAELFHRNNLTGRVVCSGYRTPGDTNGGTWSQGGETFVGVPEADAMRFELLTMDVPDPAIAVERHSVDTVTNLVRVEREGHFGDGRPVAIVAQESHLARILRIIAPRTLRRAYLGVVVSEHGEPDKDGLWPAVVSWLVLRGVYSDTEDAIRITDRRIGRVWRLARHVAKDYHTG